MPVYYKESYHTAVREGYQILLKADAELILSEEYNEIREFYGRVKDACIEWVETAEGARLRERYLELKDHRDMARFECARYVLQCKPVWESADHMAYLCESVLKMDGRTVRRAFSQVWNIKEQTMLPMQQILRLFSLKGRSCRPPFRPDGVYPYGEELIFFRNQREDEEECEYRVSIP